MEYAVLIYPKLASDYGHVATEHIRIAQECVELTKSDKGISGFVNGHSISHIRDLVMFFELKS